MYRIFKTWTSFKHGPNALKWAIYRLERNRESDFLNSFGFLEILQKGPI